VRDLRLGLETAVIARLARVLTNRLLAHDPLSEEVHLSKLGLLGWSLAGVLEGLLVRGCRNLPLRSSQVRGA
jgi:hypothetical protein